MHNSRPPGKTLSTHKAKTLQCVHACVCVHGWGAPTGRERERERELKLETFILQERERDKERDRNRDTERQREKVVSAGEAEGGVLFQSLNISTHTM